MVAAYVLMWLCTVLFVLHTWRKTRGIQQRIDDYLAMGVPYVWVLDPSTKTAYSATPAERTQQLTAGVLKTKNPSVELPLVEIFT